MGRDGRGDVGAAVAHVSHALLGRHMLHHHAQAGGAGAQGGKDAVDEHGFAVKNVDVGVGHLAMHAEGQADVGHRVQHGLHAGKIPHAGL